MKLFKTLLCATIASVTIFAFSACSAKQAPANTPESTQTTQTQTTNITVSEGSFSLVDVAAGKEYTANMSDIAAMDSVGMDVLQRTSGGDSTIHVIGTDFNNLLAQYNLTQKDLSSLRFEAMDGYSMDIPKEVVDTRTILLVYAVDGKPLTDEQAPVWMVIPEERAMYWVKNIKTIHMNESGVQPEATATSKAYLAETLFGALESTEFEGEPCIEVGKLLEQLNIPADCASAELIAADGLTKTETIDVLNKSLLTTTGEFAPKLTGTEIPEGMRVKNILSLRIADKTVVSLGNYLATASKKTYGEFTGTPLTELLSTLGMSSGQSYLLTAADGYEKELSANDMTHGIVYIGGDGKIATYFDGLPKNTTIRDLLSITVK